MIRCYSCSNLYSYEDEHKGVLHEDDDAHIWYCEECSKPKKVADFKIPFLVCQWCKQDLPQIGIINSNVISLHVDCYEKIITQMSASQDNFDQGFKHGSTVGYDDGYNAAVLDFKYKFQGYIAEAITNIQKDIN